MWRTWLRNYSFRFDSLVLKVSTTLPVATIVDDTGIGNAKPILEAALSQRDKPITDLDPGMLFYSECLVPKVLSNTL
jgi:hypothetical protein